MTALITAVVVAISTAGLFALFSPPVRASLHDYLAARAAPPAVAPRTYTVAAGDSLSLIAQRNLGDHERWPEIFATNRELLRAPERLEVGMTLNLPER